MTTIFHLPVELLLYISEFISEPMFWKFFRDSNKVFKQTFPPVSDHKKLFDSLMKFDKNGSITEVTDFLEKNKLVPDFNLYKNLVKNGYLSCLKYLRVSKNFRYEKFLNVHSHQFYHLAVKHNKLQILVWMFREKIGVYDQNNSLNYICQEAAAYDSLSILKWARGYNCSWDVSVTSAAARHRNYDVLKWCIENGCPSDESVCSRICKNGDLEMLIWAKSHGCPWNKNCYRSAKYHGHTEIQKWLKRNGCPYDKKFDYTNVLCPICTNEIDYNSNCGLCSVCSNDKKMICEYCIRTCKVCRVNGCAQCNTLGFCMRCRNFLCNTCINPISCPDCGVPCCRFCSVSGRCSNCFRASTREYCDVDCGNETDYAEMRVDIINKSSNNFIKNKLSKMKKIIFKRFHK